MTMIWNAAALGEVVKVRLLTSSSCKSPSRSQAAIVSAWLCPYDPGRLQCCMLTVNLQQVARIVVFSDSKH